MENRDLTQVNHSTEQAMRAYEDSIVGIAREALLAIAHGVQPDVYLAMQLNQANTDLNEHQITDLEHYDTALKLMVAQCLIYPGTENMVSTLDT